MAHYYEETKQTMKLIMLILTSQMLQEYYDRETNLPCGIICSSVAVWCFLTFFIREQKCQSGNVFQKRFADNEPFLLNVIH